VTPSGGLRRSPVRRVCRGRGVVHIKTSGYLYEEITVSWVLGFAKLYMGLAQPDSKAASCPEKGRMNNENVSHRVK
jgi:hypothetical protein